MCRESEDSSGMLKKGFVFGADQQGRYNIRPDDSGAASAVYSTKVQLRSLEC